MISCDFCGSDWEAYDQGQAAPMVEGHQGSVLCLVCLKRALEEMAPADAPYRCTLCLQEDLDPTLPRWYHDAPKAAPGLNPEAIICRPCIRQAAGRFNKDPDVEWEWDRGK